MFKIEEKSFVEHKSSKPISASPGDDSCSRNDFSSIFFKGEVYPEMKLSQSVELFLTKRMPPIRNPSDVWFSSCAS